MNYHRRTTRPDAAFYRDQRKVPRTGRGGRGQGISPTMIAIGVAVLGAVAFVLLRH